MKNKYDHEIPCKNEYIQNKIDQQIHETNYKISSNDIAQLKPKKTINQIIKEGHDRISSISTFFQSKTRKRPLSASLSLAKLNRFDNKISSNL